MRRSTQRGRLLVVLLVYALGASVLAQDYEGGNPWRSPIRQRWWPVAWEQATHEEKTQYPLRAVVALRSHFAGGGRTDCLAAFVGPSQLVTAAHCLYRIKHGDAPRPRYERLEIEVWPEVAPLLSNPVFEVVTARELSGFDILSSLDRPNDVAFLTIAETVGNDLGYFGIHRGGRVDGRNNSPAHTGTLPTTALLPSKCPHQGLDHIQDGLFSSVRDVVNFMAWLEERTNPEAGGFDLELAELLRICSFHNYYDHDEVASVGLSNDSLYTTQCGIAGIYKDAVVHNCPQDPGDSGGPLYFVDDAGAPIIFAVHSMQTFDGVSAFGRNNHSRAAPVYGATPSFVDYAEQPEREER